MRKQLGPFDLGVEGGQFSHGEVVVLVGENATGKTTLLSLLAGLTPPDGGVEVPALAVSYKPQHFSPQPDHANPHRTVQMLLNSTISAQLAEASFMADIVVPLGVDALFDCEVQHLSGGELQRVALVVCLGKPADLYLIDEPTTFLDAEQAATVAFVIKRFVQRTQKTAFVAEHDFTLAVYLADSMIVFEGTPAGRCLAHAPEPLLSAMNAFLSQLDITYRRDHATFRPKVNRLNCAKDQEQKLAGQFFFVDEPPEEEVGGAKPAKGEGAEDAEGDEFGEDEGDLDEADEN
jgi:ATP-binding cassette subfamily E protein 1